MSLRRQLKTLVQGLRDHFAEVEPVPALGQVRSIVFLCKGNICRSPYAMVKLEQLLQEAGIDSVNVVSAGLETTPGKPADGVALAVSARRGIDLGKHKTTSVSKETADSADLLIVMERAHLRVIETRYPELRSRSFLLSAFGRHRFSPLDIADPYGRSPAEFDRCYERIDFALEASVDQIKGSGHTVRSR